MSRSLQSWIDMNDCRCLTSCGEILFVGVGESSSCGLPMILALNTKFQILSELSFSENPPIPQGRGLKNHHWSTISNNLSLLKFFCEIKKKRKTPHQAMVNVGSNRVYCVYEDRSCTLWDTQNLEDPKIVFEYPAIRGQVRLRSAEMIAFFILIFI